jgi:RNA polymerase sigma-70 factor (ECF subfamily)
MSQRGRDAAALSEEGLEKEEQGRLLRAALAGLKEPCKQILELRDIKGASYAQISKLLKLPMGTVMSRLLRCRQVLKQKVQRSALRGAR